MKSEPDAYSIKDLEKEEETLGMEFEIIRLETL